MKSTYRAKFNALQAMNDGYSFIVIKRYNGFVSVWLDDIINTPNGEKVTEYSEPKFHLVSNTNYMTFMELMNYNK